MAAVDYHGVLTTLKTLLEADASLSGVPVFVEEDPQFDLSGAGKAIVLTLGSRRPASGQPLAAGKRTRWEGRLGVWAVGFANTFELAAKARDDLVGSLELVLMNNRTVSDKVASGWLEGGEFISVRDQSAGNYALAETVFAFEATAIA